MSALDEPVAHPADVGVWVGKDEQCTLRDMLLTGATYRQLDYWTRKGWLAPTDHEAAAPGSGYPRHWTGREQQIAHLMVRLSHVGIIGDRAARIARDGVDHGVHRITTEDGITIAWSAVA